MSALEEAAVAFVEAEAAWMATVGGDPRAEARVRLDQAQERLRGLCGWTRRYDEKSCRYVVVRVVESTRALF